MKISVVTEKLKHGLGVVDRIVSSRTTLPILNNVLIRTNEGEIYLEATDLELAVVHKLTGKIEVDGGVTVPAKLLSSFIGGLEGEVVELDVDNSVLKIESGTTKTKINGTDPDEFPVIPKIEGETILEISGHLLSQALADVAFAASSDESRLILTGVLLEISEEDVTFAATDSYRLAMRHVDKSNLTVGQPTKVVIPARAAREIGRVFAGEEKVSVIVSANQIAFVGENAKVISRLVDGEYPPYKKIIPEALNGSANLQTTKVSRAVNGALVFARDGSNTLKLKFDNEKLHISAAAADVGEYSTDVDNSGDKLELELTINGRFVLEGLNSFSGTDQVFFGVVNESSPVVMTSIGKPDLKYLVMPMKS